MFRPLQQEQLVFVLGPVAYYSRPLQTCFAVCMSTNFRSSAQQPENRANKQWMQTWQIRTTLM